MLLERCSQLQVSHSRFGPGNCSDTIGAARWLSRKASKSSVVRFRNPEIGRTVVSDLLRGDIVFDNAELDDLVLLRTDGVPTYNFVVVVDDASMGITHVLRGDDHLPNTPKQILLDEALGYDTPQFGHVPLILGEDKKRLSKRHGATSVGEYQVRGCLPEALFNYLALLGWSPGDDAQFLRTVELLQRFSLDGVSALLSSTPTSLSSSHTFDFPGPTPPISSNGTTNGIVWALDNSQWGSSCSTASTCQYLYAFDATNLANKHPRMSARPEA